MALPADFNTGTVTGTYVDLGGHPMVGQVKFTPTVTRVISAGTDTVVMSVPLIAELDGSGHFSIDLPSTDDPDINPNDWTYTVNEVFTNGATFSMDVAVGSNVDISAVIPVDPSTGNTVIHDGAGRKGTAWAIDTSGVPLASIDLGASPYKDAATIVLTSTRLATDAKTSIVMPSPAASGEFELVMFAGNGEGDWRDRFTFADAPVQVDDQGVPAGSGDSFFWNTMTPLITAGTMVGFAPDVPNVWGSVHVVNPGGRTFKWTGQWNPDSITGFVPAPVLVLGDERLLEDMGMVAPITIDTSASHGTDADLGHDPSYQDIPTVWVDMGTSPGDHVDYVLPLSALTGLGFVAGHPAWVRQEIKDGAGRHAVVLAYLPAIPTDDHSDTVVWLLMGGVTKSLTIPHPAVSGTQGAATDPWFSPLPFLSYESMLAGPAGAGGATGPSGSQVAIVPVGFTTVAAGSTPYSSLVKHVGGGLDVTVSPGDIFLCRSAFGAQTIDHFAINVANHDNNLAGGEKISLLLWNPNGTFNAKFDFPAAGVAGDEVADGSGDGWPLPTSGPVWIGIFNPAENSGSISLRSVKPIGEFVVMGNHTPATVSLMQGVTNAHIITGPAIDISTSILRASPSGAYGSIGVTVGNDFPMVGAVTA